jgi:hypothetical protein
VNHSCQDIHFGGGGGFDLKIGFLGSFYPYPELGLNFKPNSFITRLGQKITNLFHFFPISGPLCPDAKNQTLD